MKKVITTIFSLIFCIVIMLTNKSNAVSLDTLEVKLDKTKVKPGEDESKVIMIAKNRAKEFLRKNIVHLSLPSNIPNSM